MTRYQRPMSEAQLLIMGIYFTGKLIYNLTSLNKVVKKSLLSDMRLGLAWICSHMKSWKLTHINHSSIWSSLMWVYGSIHHANTLSRLSCKVWNSAEYGATFTAFWFWVNMASVLHPCCQLGTTELNIFVSSCCCYFWMQMQERITAKLGLESTLLPFQGQHFDH